MSTEPDTAAAEQRLQECGRLAGGELDGVGVPARVVHLGGGGGLQRPLIPHLHAPPDYFPPTPRTDRGISNIGHYFLGLT